jgi:hypothetical protein
MRRGSYPIGELPPAPGLEVGDLPLPGMDQLRSMCGQAERVLELCRLFGIRPEVNGHTSGDVHRMVDDRDHYIWDD